MISGGGSAQVDPPEATPLRSRAGRHALAGGDLVSHLAAEGDSGRAPKANVKYDSGADPGGSRAAKGADVAIVFAYQWESEGMDLPSLSLPHNQDELIAKVAAANPHTIVVLETGSPVTMPWVDAPAAILEAWYAGSDGANAVGNVLFGRSTPRASCPTRSPRARPICLIRPSPAAAGICTSRAPLHPSSGPRACRRSRSLTTRASRSAISGMTRRRSPYSFRLAYGLSYTSYRYSGLQ
jgi:beta-glucosidase